MSQSFLQAYARALILELIERDLIEIVDGRQAAVVDFVAEYMTTHGQNQSAISLTGLALLACPDVDELYADDEALKDAVDALRG